MKLPIEQQVVELSGCCKGPVQQLLWSGKEEACVPGELIRGVGVLQASIGRCGCTLFLNPRVARLAFLDRVHSDPTSGATLGDFLDKPLEHGGLELSRPIASAVIAAIMIACILVLPQRAGRHPGQAASVS